MDLNKYPVLMKLECPRIIITSDALKSSLPALLLIAVVTGYQISWQKSTLKARRRSTVKNIVIIAAVVAVVEPFVVLLAAVVIAVVVVVNREEMLKPQFVDDWNACYI
ncbi:hypothetical protein ACTXT7_013474 [Hymenolepis weldensis]